MLSFVDPYIDPNTGILRNLVGATNYPELRKVEGNIVALAEISLDDIPHTVDLIELQKIHRNLFSKIYDWAGELRKVNIRKGNKEYFLDYAYLENGTKFIFDNLHKENCLHNLDRENFIKRLAYFYEQLNFIHPFREGNGRAQRIFWQIIANKARYKIDWNKAIGEELNNASLVGRVENNLKPLETIFNKIVSEKMFK